MKDPAGTPAMQDAIRHLHGLESTWLESVAVHKQDEGGTVWAGHVQVFEIGHPQDHPLLRVEPRERPWWA